MSAFLKLIAEHKKAEKNVMPQERHDVYALWVTFSDEFLDELKDKCCEHVGIEACPSWPEARCVKTQKPFAFRKGKSFSLVSVVKLHRKQKHSVSKEKQMNAKDRQMKSSRRLKKHKGTPKETTDKIRTIKGV